MIRNGEVEFKVICSGIYLIESIQTDKQVNSNIYIDDENITLVNIFGEMKLKKGKDIFVIESVQEVPIEQIIESHSKGITKFYDCMNSTLKQFIIKCEGRLRLREANQEEKKMMEKQINELKLI